jgi:hypothetical protein
VSASENAGPAGVLVDEEVAVAGDADGATVEAVVVMAELVDPISEEAGAALAIAEVAGALTVARGGFGPW